MAEPPSPRTRTTTEEQERLESPTTPFSFLSIDARALPRAASVRHSADPIDRPPPSSPPDTCLSKDQILDLLQNCIKLASENKINRKNVWELRLIDHLSDLLRLEGEVDAETHFQKASCTLEAGVKIYSLRVDSVHAEAYNVLAGIIRAGHVYEQEHIMSDVNGKKGRDTNPVRKEMDNEISPLSTVESSFEALEKKFDVDPVYHHMPAQFGEGGAKGLLLNNLGIYGKCEVLFDSFEVPGKCRPPSLQNDTPDMNHLINLSFAKELIEQMTTNMLVKNEISPSLHEIMCQLAEDNIRSSQTLDVGQESDVWKDAANDDGLELNATIFQKYNRSEFDHDERTVNESSSSECPFQSYPQKDPYTMDEADAYGNADDVFIFPLQRLGLTSKQNTWAGPDHWKYRKSKGQERAPATESGPACTSAIKKLKNRNLIEADSGFMEYLERETLAIFSPPKNPNSLLLPANREPSCNTLPEDCHYQPEDLVKLFLLPNRLCIGKKIRQFSDYSWEQNDNFNGAPPSWDNESMLSGHYNNSAVHDGAEKSDEQISQPCQVDKFKVQCDRTSKWIDVHVLKETLWGHIQNPYKVPKMASKDVISFKNILATLSVDHRAAAPQNISPHLCFICLLHLANEHGLIIRGCPDLDDLTIQLRSLTANP